ncbi:MAG: hypothetical protein GY868_18740 [Deltaproteobacteria bacterium]|nr:hypothetical protein [Deltaproteobacteria bacterium]
MTDIIKGVFVVEKTGSIGTGHTAKKVVQKMYCIAKQTDNGDVAFRYLGADDKPMTATEKIPRDEFLRKFTLQPYYLENKKAQRKKNLDKNIARAEEHLRKNELHSAEFEYSNALKLDEEDLKANFGMGNVYLAMGEKEKAKDVFVKLSKIDAIFEEKNKHFFNECAIQLRKQELYDESIEYYVKAIKISPSDENLCFNASRAYFEKEDMNKAGEYIQQALSINPNFKEAKKLLGFIEAASGDSS